MDGGFSEELARRGANSTMVFSHSQRSVVAEYFATMFWSLGGGIKIVATIADISLETIPVIGGANTLEKLQVKVIDISGKYKLLVSSE